MVEDSQHQVVLTLKVLQDRLNFPFGFRVDFKIRVRPSFRMMILQVLPHHDQRHQADLDRFFFGFFCSFFIDVPLDMCSLPGTVIVREKRVQVRHFQWPAGRLTE